MKPGRERACIIVKAARLSRESRVAVGPRKSDYRPRETLTWLVRLRINFTARRTFCAHVSYVDASPGDSSEGTVCEVHNVDVTPWRWRPFDRRRPKPDEIERNLNFGGRKCLSTIRSGDERKNTTVTSTDACLTLPGRPEHAKNLLRLRYQFFNISVTALYDPSSPTNQDHVQFRCYVL
jgi:hypothetical protein